MTSPFFNQIWKPPGQLYLKFIPAFWDKLVRSATQHFIGWERSGIWYGIVNSVVGCKENQKYGSVFFEVRAVLANWQEQNIYLSIW